MATTTSPPPILLLIDLQQGLTTAAPPEWGPRSTPTLLDNVTQLLETWRSRSWPVLHVQHDDIFDSTNPIAAIYPETYAIHPAAAPVEGEPVFVKNVGSPFVASGLRAKVEELGVLAEGEGKRKIVVIGMDAAQCVSDTTRSGTDSGYKIVVVGDATAAYGMDDWITGKLISGEETHRAAMSMLMGYATVTTTDKVLSVLGYEG